MAEYSGVAQTVPAGGSVVFTIANVPCTKGLVNADLGSGNFLLKGVLQNGSYVPSNCCRKVGKTSIYKVTFGANVAIPEGGEVGEITLAFAVDGGQRAGTTMRSTPTAVNQFNNVGRTTNVSIFNGCCQTVTVINTGTSPILVSEPNIVFDV